MPSLSFNSSNGIVQGQQVHDAFLKVSADLNEIAYKIYYGSDYASHVTQEQKDNILKESIKRCALIAEGKCTSFAVWQRVNKELTGDCIGFLSK